MVFVLLLIACNEINTKQPFEKFESILKSESIYFKTQEFNQVLLKFNDGRLYDLSDRELEALNTEFINDTIYSIHFAKNEKTNSFKFISSIKDNEPTYDNFPYEFCLMGNDSIRYNGEDFQIKDIEPALEEIDLSGSDKMIIHISIENPEKKKLSELRYRQIFFLTQYLFSKLDKYSLIISPKNYCSPPVRKPSRQTEMDEIINSS